LSNVVKNVGFRNLNGVEVWNWFLNGWRMIPVGWKVFGEAIRMVIEFAVGGLKKSVGIQERRCICGRDTCCVLQFKDVL
jgi:hypothetical protein